MCKIEKHRDQSENDHPLMGIKSNDVAASRALQTILFNLPRPEQDQRIGTFQNTFLLNFVFSSLVNVISLTTRMKTEARNIKGQTVSSKLTASVPARV